MPDANVTGTLYLCATPIGNLEDISLRALRILKSVAVIAAEDTRHTRKLLNHFEIHTQLISYHEHNKVTRGPELVDKLRKGEDIALVSDAGVPGISDPGEDLVRLAIDAGVQIVPIPGANAALSALIASGLKASEFIFAGFLPRSGKKRREAMERLRNYSATIVLYESPHHLLKTLEGLAALLGDRQAVAARELTKVYEEFVRGSLSELHRHFSDKAPRGEFTLIVAGYTDAGAALPQEKTTPQNLEQAIECIETLIRAGAQKKDAIRMVASKSGLQRRALYQLMLDK